MPYHFTAGHPMGWAASHAGRHAFPRSEAAAVAAGTVVPPAPRPPAVSRNHTFGTAVCCGSERVVIYF